MYKTVSFNIYKEHLENIVFAERNNGIKQNNETEETNEKPIPKPPPIDWTDSISYKSFNRESESTDNN